MKKSSPLRLSVGGESSCHKEVNATFLLPPVTSKRGKGLAHHRIHSESWLSPNKALFKGLRLLYDLYPQQRASEIPKMKEIPVKPIETVERTKQVRRTYLLKRPQIKVEVGNAIDQYQKMFTEEITRKQTLRSPGVSDVELFALQSPKRPHHRPKGNFHFQSEPSLPPLQSPMSPKAGFFPTSQAYIPSPL